MSKERDDDAAADKVVSTDAMSHMVNVMIDSDDEDTESHAHQILGKLAGLSMSEIAINSSTDRRLAILHAFCTPSALVVTPP